MTNDHQLNSLLKEARQLYERQDYEGALAIYLDIAKQGHVESQTFVGWMYFECEGVQNDLQEAQYWLGLAAEHGDRLAQWHLGDMFSRKKSFEVAACWFRKSAEQGYGPALYRLAVYYHLGRSVPKDENRFIDLLKEATAKGNVKAQMEYAKRLIRGRAGIKGILRGIRLLIGAFDSFVRVRMKNPNDERLRW